MNSNAYPELDDADRFGDDAGIESGSESGIDSGAHDGTDADAAIERELDALLSEPGLRRSPQMSAFLRYVVTRTLAGDASRIKAYTIGIDALGKPPEFDPQSDPSVRVLAKRLRDRLHEHYRQRPDASPRIEFRPGSYVPRFAGLDGERADDATVATGLPATAAQRADLRAPAAPAVATRDDVVNGHRSGDTFFAMPDGRRTYDRMRSSPSLPGPIGARRLEAVPSASRVRPSDPTVLYVLSSPKDDAQARRLAFVLSGMLTRLGSVDVRRASDLPAAPQSTDLVVSLHALPLEEGLRVDLQLARGGDGAILDAEVLMLSPAGANVLGSGDLELMERWVAQLSSVLPASLSAGAGGPGAQVGSFARRSSCELGERRTPSMTPSATTAQPRETSRPASSSAWLASAPRSAR